MTNILDKIRGGRTYSTSIMPEYLLGLTNVLETLRELASIQRLPFQFYEIEEKNQSQKPIDYHLDYTENKRIRSGGHH